MSYIVIIPARLKSSRLEEKLLQDIYGKPLIQYTYANALQSKASRVLIATDSEKIQSVCQNFGAEAIMTGEHHHSGTSRISEVVKTLNIAKNEIIVNLQGDEPMVHPKIIDQVASILENSEAQMSSLFERIQDEKTYNDPNCVKVVCNRDKMAMYFSRAPIPVFRNDVPELDKCYKHIGIYAYRAWFVEELVGLKQSDYEKYEKLEQLSALYEGYKIQMDEACMKPGIGVDTESDLFELKEALKDANN